MNNKVFDIFYDELNSVYQVRTKTNAVVIEFSQPVEEEIFKEIVALYEKQSFYTFPQLLKYLQKRYAYEYIFDVVKELTDCGLLTSENFEDSEAVLNLLDAQKHEYTVPIDLTEKRVGLIGDNEFMSKVRCRLRYYDIKSTFYLDMSSKLSKEDIVKIIESSDFIIVDEIHFNPNLMGLINETALKENKPWMLVEGAIDTFNFSIGPIFHGKSTGCYNCFQKRLLSNDTNRLYTHAYHHYLEKANKASKPDMINEAVSDILSSLLVMDIIKYLKGYSVPQTWRNTLIFNSTRYSIEQHYFLKAPVCPVCNSNIEYSPSIWYESLSVK